MKSLWVLRFLIASLLFGLAALGPGKAYAGTNPDCPRLLDGSRSELKLSSERITAVVEEVWVDRLIRELETEHLDAVARPNGSGPKAWRAFSPTWVLKSPSTLSQAVEYFDPSDGSSPEFEGTVHEWMAAWESGYKANIGPIATSWVEKNRRRFLQKLLVESAVHYALREGFDRPEAFLSAMQDRFPSYSPMGTGIEIAFRSDVGSFQKEFDKAFRQHSGIGLDLSSARVPPHETQVRSDLRRVGVDVTAVRSWQPVVAASYRERTGEQDIQLVVESVRASGNASTGIFALLQESTDVSDGHEQTGFGTAALNAALERAGSAKKLFEVVNRALVEESLPVIQPSQGAKNFAEEIVVQMALYSWISVHGTTSFEGFQASDDKEPVYFEMGSDLVQRSGLTMADINELVSRRLTSLGLPSDFPVHGGTP